MCAITKDSMLCQVFVPGANQVCVQLQQVVCLRDACNQEYETESKTVVINALFYLVGKDTLLRKVSGHCKDIEKQLFVATSEFFLFIKYQVWAIEAVNNDCLVIS